MTQYTYLTCTYILLTVELYTFHLLTGDLEKVHSKYYYFLIIFLCAVV